MTLEEQLALQAKKGLMGLGLEEETAEEYGPWASLLAQFLPGVGEGVGIDNTVNAINDERYGDAAIEGGLTLLGAVPVVGDMAAAAIKGIRRAPTSLLDDAVDAGKKVDEIEIPARPEGLPRFRRDMNPDQLKAHDQWKKSYNKAMQDRKHARHGERKNSAKRKATEDRRAEEKRKRVESAELLPQDMSPEQLKAYNAEKARASRASRTPEQIEAQRAKDRAAAQKRRAAINADPEKRAAHLKKKSEDGKRWRQENPEAAKAKSRETYEKDPALAYERWVRRHHAQKERTPSWRDQEKINEIYRSAKSATESTGIPHEVDHVIPLRGKNTDGPSVSGLHHQDNLLVVPRADNRSKANIFEPGDLPPRAGVRKSRAYLKKLKAAQEAAKRK